MQLTEEQILALAPDDSSRKSGKDLSNPAKWVSKGINEQALWGECQGSGSKPYQTQVDIVNLAFKCSCPSRKFPCKHGIGLLLLHARQAATFTHTASPSWVAEWLEKRTKREEKKTEAADKPVDEAAQAKRKVAREQGVEEGMTELLRWIKDIVRNGILNIPEKDASFFTNMAKRMVDAKAPGLSGMVKTLGNTDFYKEGWQSHFMDQLLRIYLVVSGFHNKATLPAPLAEDIRSWIGFTQSQEELKAQTGITDTWLVLARQTSEEESLLVERNWLYGTQSNQYALVLQFSVRGQGINFTFSPGMYVQAELVFYPSAQPLRAIIKQQLSSNTQAGYTPFNGWQQVAETAAGIYMQLPFDAERPFIIEKVKPVLHDGRWWLADNSQHLVQVKDDYKQLHTLLALGGGQPLDMAVLGKENVYEPLGVWDGQHYINISN